jgi:hypothetical protein
MQHIFSHPWHTMTAAHWRKYPNERAKHVKSVDILERYVDEKGHLHTIRLIVCKQPVPSVLQRFGFEEEGLFREVSVIDPITQIATSTTTNLSYTNVLSATEICIFQPNPSEPSSTLFKQSGQVIASRGFSIFGRLIEDAAVNRFYANAHMGREGLELTLKRLFEEAESRMVNGFKELQRDLKQAASNISSSFEHAASSIEQAASTAASSIEQAAAQSAPHF